MRLALFTIAAILAATPALAETGRSNSKIITYPVSGKTAKAINESIRKASPKIARNATYAFTVPSIKLRKAHKKSATSCRYSRFATDSHFIYVVPKLSNRKSVPPALLKKWDSFAAYLLAHEKTHGKMWRACLAEHDEEARALEANSCEALDKKRERLFTALKKRCVAADEKFDFYFRKDVLKQPFVEEALKK